MRVLVIGASGFVGRAVSRELRAKHEVVAASRYITHGIRIDLLDPKSISAALKKIRPDAIVNCAGIVENREQAANNPVMTRNLLEQVAASGLPIKRIVIIGAASEYGLVDKLPVNETADCVPVSPYGASKKEEVDIALWFRQEKHLPVVVARLFNPIGPGMPPRMLLPGVMRQIAAFRSGETAHIEVGRLDAKRDYFDIADAGRAVALLLGKTPKYGLYNVGCGVSTTNRELVEAVLAKSSLADKPKLLETSETPEPLLASQADISRIQKEFGFKPQHTLVEALKGIVKVNVVVVGAGKAGELIVESIRKSKDSPFEVVGFVDDDEKKRDKEVLGIRVYGGLKDLASVIDQTGATEVIIAMPSQRGSVVKSVMEAAEGKRLVYRILPRISEVLAQSFDKDFLQYVRKLEVGDLVGGAIPKADQVELRKHVRRERVLITGAAGSIGSELSRQIALYKAEKVVFYDWWENGMYELRRQILDAYPNGDFEFIIGDMKDKKKINYVMRTHKPTTVFHAGAYKHVPLMEDNPAEAVRNNIMGTRTVAESAVKHGVKKFLLVSTDKAVNPTNVMGATKRAAEKIIHILAESQKGTTFCAVRFGNVVNSNGSVIPLFEEQIERGGPVGVTAKEMTRFLMTIPEAVHLILKAWIMGENNDLFVLDMGEPVKIYDLARWLIIMNGYVPNKDIKIEIIGLRPGEKMYEEVLVKQEEVSRTTVENVFRTKNYLKFDRLAFLNNLTFLMDSLYENELDSRDIRLRLKGMIPTYQPKDL